MEPAIITHVRKYVPLSEIEADVLLSFLRLISVKKKQDLLKEGQICRSDFFVEKGCLRFFFINEKGTEQITQFAIENWWLSDYMSFSMQTTSGFNIQSVEAGQLYALDFDIQEKLFIALPQMERYFRVMFIKSTAAAQQRIKYVYGMSREQMYQHFKESFPEFVQRIPQYMLASFLGFTPEYLSELRRKG